MAVELTLDAREMEPPEPFERATAILHQLESGQYLRMLHRRIPYPLVDHARAMSLACKVTELETTIYEIIIYTPADEDALCREGIL
jgi:hypothetical protein